MNVLELAPTLANPINPTIALEPNPLAKPAEGLSASPIAPSAFALVWNG
jgi:hypothetical protein